MKTSSSGSIFHMTGFLWEEFNCDHPNSKVDGANMGPIWGRQDPDGPHLGPMNFAIWAVHWKPLKKGWWCKVWKCSLLAWSCWTNSQVAHDLRCLKSLLPSDVTWHHKSRSTLAQVKAPESMLIYYQRCSVVFPCEQFHKKCSWT